MSENLKRIGGRWLPAWMAALRYCALAMVVAFVGLLDQYDAETWARLTSYDFWRIASTVAAAGLTAMGAVMNGSWQKAAAKQD